MGNRNCMIGFPNRIDAATLSGGSWAAGRPLTKLKNRQIGDVARSTNLAKSSTTFSIDLGAPKNIRVIDIRNHNLSLRAKCRIRGSNEGAMTNYLADFGTVGQWNAGAVNSVANSGAAPDGSMTARKVVLTDTTGVLFFSRIASPGASVTLSVFAKRGDAGSTGQRQFGIYNVTTNADLAYALVDLSSGGGYLTGPLAASSTLKITDYGSGWYRIAVTIRAGLSVNDQINCYAGHTGGSGMTIGDNFYVWGPQLEVGEKSTSLYVGAVGATRPAGYVDDWQAYDYDSKWFDAWPVIYPFGALEWEDDSWWSGKYSDEQRGGYIAAATHVIPSQKLARGWRIDFDDALNPAGFVQVGRVFIGPAWQPKANMSFGASIGWETTTEVQEAYSGSEYFDVRTPFRVARFALDWLTEDEGMSNAFELQRQAGVDKEVMWIHDPEDTVHALRRRFLGRIRQLSPVEFPYANVTKNAFEIKELL